MKTSGCWFRLNRSQRVAQRAAPMIRKLGSGGWDDGIDPLSAIRRAGVPGRQVAIEHGLELLDVAAEQIEEPAGLGRGQGMGFGDPRVVEDLSVQVRRHDSSGSAPMWASTWR